MAKTLTVVLIVALCGSNLLWWLARDASSDAVMPPSQAADVTASANQTEAQLRSLEKELRAARARITELELGAERTLAPVHVRSEEAERDAQLELRRQAMERRRLAQKMQAGWVEDALQTEDLGKRAAVLEDIRRALESGDPVAMHAALRALARIRKLDYDKAAFRSQVLPCLQSPDGSVRAAALYALFNTDPRGEDLATILSMYADPSKEVRSSLAHAIFLFNEGAIEGEAADVVLRLFDDADAGVRERTRRTLWGARVDSRIEDRFLAMLDDPRLRHDAIYFGLSTFVPKSPRVVDALIAALADANSEIRHRAAWGLGTGVVGESRERVADAFLQLLGSRSDPRQLEECVRMLRSYGSARHVPDLNVFLARPGLTASLRTRVEQLVATLQTR